MAFRKPNRELSVTEILSFSFGLYIAKFDVMLVPFLFINVFNTFATDFLWRLTPVFELPQNITEEFFLQFFDYLAAIFPLIVVIIVVNWVITTIANGIVVKLSSEALEGKTVSVKIGLDSVLSSLLTLLVASLIVSILTVFGLFFFVIPGIVVATMFSLTVQVVMIERLGMLASLYRSRKLVANRWLKVLTILSTFMLLMVIANIIGQAIGSSVTSFNTTMALIIESVVSSLVQPIQPISLTLLYYSLRTREKPSEQLLPPQLLIPRRKQPYPYSQLPPYFQPKFCYKCGVRLPPDAVFCPQCGIRVRTE
ncbi:hypothetical protein KEJ18_03890 [Candidatus Bathyarchaeota archaeon]|nr:hypothetical protein [Candidatus Bathyarchaeota archaeon]